MCTYTHTCTHTHTHTCTHTPWAVSHSRININALLFYFLIIDPHTNIVFSCHPIHHMTSIGAVPLSKLSCVSMCTFMHAHTYTPHTSTSTHTHAHKPTCTCTHIHVHTQESCFDHKRVHMYTLKWLWQSFITHTHMHTHIHTHTQNWPLLCKIII